MKILYVLPYYPFSLRSGSSVRASNIIRRLVPDHEVHILCLGLGQRTDPTLAETETQCASITTIPHKFSRIMSALKSVAFAAPYDTVIHRNRQFEKALTERIRAINPDCIYYSRFGIAPYVQRNLRVPQILDQHDLSHAFWRTAAQGAERVWFRIFSRLNVRFSKRKEKALYPLFDAVVSVSAHEMAETRPLLKKNAHLITIPNGADTDYYRPGKDIKEPPTIVFTGAMNAQRNIDAVLRFSSRMFPKVLKAHPDTTLQVVGHSPSASITELGNQDHTHITGEVDDVRPYIRDATVIIAPFWSGSGVKHKVPIAMSMGKALVATPNACQGLDITDQENALIASSDEEFATAVIRVLDDPNLRARLGNNARQFIVSHYSWDSLVGDLTNWLETCVIGNDSSP